MDYEILKPLLIVIVLGFIIGMQRTLTYIHTSEAIFGGSRTFALIALGGFLSGWLQSYISGFVLVSTAIFAFHMILSYYLKAQKQQKQGMTTQITAIITFFLGLMVWYDLENYAIFIAVIVIILLEIKPRLLKFESHISSSDINAVILLLAMSFIILPILPDEMIGPYNLFNPYKTWLMAVIIAAISFVGYTAIKIFGHKHGVFLTGAAGGLISSTAVTISLSKMYQNRYELINNYAGGIAIAWTFMYLRVLFEVFIIYPEFSVRLAPAFLGATISGLLFSYYLHKNSKNTSINIDNPDISKNPLQLSEAIKFGILFGIIYGAIAFVQTRYGNIGIYFVSFFSGVSDVDAITLSLSQLAKDGKIDEFASIMGIVIASVTNAFIKLCIAYWIGGVKFGWKMTQFLILTLSIMGIGLFIEYYTNL